MSQPDEGGAGARKAPQVKAVSRSDVIWALRAGMADFGRAPVYGLFFGGIFALGGLAFLAFLQLWDMPWMLIFIGLGFPLIGPFAAAGLYEISRKLAAGEELNWRGILVLVFAQRERQLGWMAFVVLFVFWIWFYQVRLLIALFMGTRAPASLGGFLEVALTTSQGQMFLLVGTAVGALLALVLFSLTVISIPLLLDRDVDFVTAMITSVKAVRASPWVMFGWGITVAALAIVAMIPAFLGLAIVFPVLGHATWHLYTRAVEPEG